MKKIFVLLFLPGVLIAQKKKKDTIAKEKNIEEVVITSSYGTRKLKEEVVGAITTISAKDINTNQAFESIDKMIAGLSPGVQIDAGSELGKNVAINIRGLGTAVSLNGNNIGTSTQPLIIIDGIILKEDQPFDATFFNGESNSEININSLARLSTDNIENISILKDAAAVALYGADAANGVIIITTRKGKKGKPKFNFTTQYGINTAINKIKYLNGEQYHNLYQTYLKNNSPSYVIKPWNGIDVNWFDLMNTTGDFYKTNFGMSGGAKWVNYRFGIDYSNNNEPKINNRFEKRGIDASLGFQIKKINIDVFAQYGELIKSAPNSFFNFILAPTFSVYDANGNYQPTGFRGIPNPLAAANQNIDKTNTKSLLSSINVNYSPFKDFKISSIFGVDYSKKEDLDWRPGTNESGQNSGNFSIDGVTYPNFGKSYLKFSNSLKWNWSVQATYQKEWAEKHHLDGILGAEVRAAKDDKEFHSGNNFINYTDYQLPWNAASYLDVNNKLIYGYFMRTLTSEDKGRSYFLQVNYDYKKKYFFSGTIRRDESSAFGKDINAAYNGAIGLSWVLTNEEFLKNQNFLSFLRLRSSWGMTGNSRIGSYRSSGLYNVNQNGFDYGYDYAYPDNSSPRNNELGWEKNEKYNLGLDFNIMKFLEVSLDVFRNNISDMIVSRDVPLETGYTSAQINGQSMYNQGVDLGIKINWIKKAGYNFNTNFNIGTIKNNVTDILGFGDDFSIATNARAQKIGVPTSAIWGYEYVGVNPATGQDQFLINGTPTDANLFTLSTSQWKIIGDSQPDAVGGLRNSFTYKNLTLSMLMNFEWGGDRLIIGELIDKYTILVNRNMSVNALDYWTSTNTDASNHIPRSNARIVSNSTKYLYDNTHIKFQNVNVSYRLPLKYNKFTVVKDANIFVDVTNLGYWYKQKSPEGKNGIREFRFLYPEMRTVSLGFRMNF